MRTFKFRAWDGKRMHDDFVLVDIDWISKKNIGCPVNAGFSQLPDEGWVIMQFTELHDKNGKEVFEGDIVNWFHPTSEVLGVVEYQSEWEGPSPEVCCFGVRIGGIFYCFQGDDGYEIIGNIYEHKELLK
jgi:uncharacterized phage protein (TIGR01671 family)